MAEPILPKYISIILKKAIAAILAIAFLFNDIAFAGDFQNLAPKSSLTIVEFKERFAKGYDVLRHEAFNSYIAKYIASRVKKIGLDKVTKEDIDGIGKVDITQFLETRPDVVRVDIDGMKVWQDILIAAVPDLFANRGQFAGVGLGRWNGMPVIYVDKLFYYDESKISAAKDEIPIEDKRAVIDHDKKETAKWIQWKWMREDLARQWGCVVRGDFRGLWIKGNPGAKEAAYAFHKDSGSLDHLFHKYKHLLNWEELYQAYLESGSIFDSEDTGADGDVNIAAGGTAFVAAAGARPASTFIRETREKSYLAADAGNVIRSATENILPHEVDRKPLKVLDLMSGHNTYLSDSINVGEIAGIGLNIEELKGNKKITHPLVQDLNKNTALPFESNYFDAVTITCGMAYMRQPRRLFKEIYRVLKPGGTLFIAFNDQYYEADVTAEWRELSQNGMVEITKRWVASGGAFEPIKHERKFYTIGSGSYAAKRLLDIIAARKPAPYIPVTTSPVGHNNNFLNAGAAAAPRNTDPADASDIVPGSFGGATSPEYYIPEVLQQFGPMSQDALFAAFEGKNIPEKDVASALEGLEADKTVIEKDGLLSLASSHEVGQRVSKKKFTGKVKSLDAVIRAASKYINEMSSSNVSLLRARERFIQILNRLEELEEYFDSLKRAGIKSASKYAKRAANAQEAICSFYRGEVMFLSTASAGVPADETAKPKPAPAVSADTVFAYLDGLSASNITREALQAEYTAFKARVGQGGKTAPLDFLESLASDGKIEYAVAAARMLGVTYRNSKEKVPARFCEAVKSITKIAASPAPPNPGSKLAVDATAAEVEEFVQSINTPLQYALLFGTQAQLCDEGGPTEKIFIYPFVCVQAVKMAKRLLQEKFSERINVEVVQVLWKKAHESSSGVAGEVHYLLEITTPQHRRYYLSFADGQFTSGFKGVYYQQKQHIYENGMVDNDVLVTSPYYIEWYLENKLDFVNFRNITDDSDYRKLKSEMGIEELARGDIAEKVIEDERIDEVDRLFKMATANPVLAETALRKFSATRPGTNVDLSPTPPQGAEPKDGLHKPYEPFRPKNLMPDEEPTPLPDTDGTVNLTGSVRPPQPGRPSQVSGVPAKPSPETLFNAENIEERFAKNKKELEDFIRGLGLSNPDRILPVPDLEIDFSTNRPEVVGAEEIDDLWWEAYGAWYENAISRYFEKLLEEYPAHHTGQAFCERVNSIKERFKELGIDVTGLDVLDVGTGWGGSLCAAKDEGASFVWGVDASRKMLDRAAANAAEFKLTDVNFTVDSATHLSTIDRKFDVVIARNTLSYLPPRMREKSMRRMRDVCKDGGRVIMMESQDLRRDDWNEEVCSGLMTAAGLEVYVKKPLLNHQYNVLGGFITGGIKPASAMPRSAAAAAAVAQSEPSRETDFDEGLAKKLAGELANDLKPFLGQMRRGLDNLNGERDTGRQKMYFGEICKAADSVIEHLRMMPGSEGKNGGTRDILRDSVQSGGAARDFDFANTLSSIVSIGSIPWNLEIWRDEINEAVDKAEQINGFISKYANSDEPTVFIKGNNDQFYIDFKASAPRSAKPPEGPVPPRFMPRVNHYTPPEKYLDVPPEPDDASRTTSDERRATNKGAAVAEEKESLHRLLEKIGLKYADTWYEDIKALPEVRKAYKGDLSAFVRAAEDNLDHPRTIISLAYSALMRYLEHPSTTNLGRHGWMIEDLRQKLPGIIEKKLASQDPKEKVLTVWDLGCGYLEPVLIASVILEEFDNHKEWGLPGEKIKVVIKAVDVDPETGGRIDAVLEDGFPYDAESVLLGKRFTPSVVKDLIRRYISFVHKKENRRRIKESGLIEFVRESIAHEEQVLNPAVENGDILYMSYVLWELTEEARAQVLERLKYIKKGALVYIRDVDSINIGGVLAGIGIKTTPLYTAETDVQHSSTTHVLIKGEKPQPGHADHAASFKIPSRNTLNRKQFFELIAGASVAIELAKGIARAQPQGLGVDVSSKIDESDGRWPEEDIRAEVINALRTLALHSDIRYRQIEKIHRQDIGNGRMRFWLSWSRDWGNPHPYFADIIFSKEDFTSSRLKEERLDAFGRGILGREYESLERQGPSIIRYFVWALLLAMGVIPIAIAIKEAWKAYDRRLRTAHNREALRSQQMRDQAIAASKSGRSAPKEAVGGKPSKNAGKAMEALEDLYTKLDKDGTATRFDKKGDDSPSSGDPEEPGGGGGRSKSPRKFGDRSFLPPEIEHLGDPTPMDDHELFAASQGRTLRFASGHPNKGKPVAGAEPQQPTLTNNPVAADGVAPTGPSLDNPKSKGFTDTARGKDIPDIGNNRFATGYGSKLGKTSRGEELMKRASAQAASSMAAQDVPRNFDFNEYSKFRGYLDSFKRWNYGNLDLLFLVDDHYPLFWSVKDNIADSNFIDDPRFIQYIEEAIGAPVDEKIFVAIRDRAPPDLAKGDIDLFIKMFDEFARSDDNAPASDAMIAIAEKSGFIAGRYILLLRLQSYIILKYKLCNSPHSPSSKFVDKFNSLIKDLQPIIARQVYDMACEIDTIYPIATAEEKCDILESSIHDKYGLELKYLANFTDLRDYLRRVGDSGPQSLQFMIQEALYRAGKQLFPGFEKFGFYNHFFGSDTSVNDTVPIFAQRKDHAERDVKRKLVDNDKDIWPSEHNPFRIKDASLPAILTDDFDAIVAIRKNILFFDSRLKNVADQVGPGYFMQSELASLPEWFRLLIKITEASAKPAMFGPRAYLNKYHDFIATIAQVLNEVRVIQDADPKVVDEMVKNCTTLYPDCLISEMVDLAKTMNKKGAYQTGTDFGALAYFVADAKHFPQFKNFKVEDYYAEAMSVLSGIGTNDRIDMFGLSMHKEINRLLKNASELIEDEYAATGNMPRGGRLREITAPLLRDMAAIFQRYYRGSIGNTNTVENLFEVQFKYLGDLIETNRYSFNSTSDFIEMVMEDFYGWWFREQSEEYFRWSEEVLKEVENDQSAPAGQTLLFIGRGADDIYETMQTIWSASRKMPLDMRSVVISRDMIDKYSSQSRSATLRQRADGGRNDAMILKYLYDKGALDSPRIFFVDTGFLGNIPRALANILNNPSVRADFKHRYGIDLPCSEYSFKLSMITYNEYRAKDPDYCIQSDYLVNVKDYSRRASMRNFDEINRNGATCMMDDGLEKRLLNNVNLVQDRDQRVDLVKTYTHREALYRIGHKAFLNALHKYVEAKRGGVRRDDLRKDVNIAEPRDEKNHGIPVTAESSDANRAQIIDSLKKRGVPYKGVYVIDDLPADTTNIALYDYPGSHEGNAIFFKYVNDAIAARPDDETVFIMIERSDIEISKDPDGKKRAFIKSGLIMQKGELYLTIFKTPLITHFVIEPQDELRVVLEEADIGVVPSSRTYSLSQDRSLQHMLLKKSGIPINDVSAAAPIIVETDDKTPLYVDHEYQIRGREDPVGMKDLAHRAKLIVVNSTDGSKPSVESETVLIDKFHDGQLETVAYMLLEDFLDTIHYTNKPLLTAGERSALRTKIVSLAEQAGQAIIYEHHYDTDILGVDIVISDMKDKDGLPTCYVDSVSTFFKIDHEIEEMVGASGRHGWGKEHFRYFDKCFAYICDLAQKYKKDQGEFEILPFDALIEKGLDREELIKQLAVNDMRAFGHNISARTNKKREFEEDIRQRALNNVIFVARNKDEVVGSLIIEKISPTEARLVGLSVIPGYQLKNIGTRLMDQASEWGAENGIEFLNLIAARTKKRGVKPSTGFYEKYFGRRGMSIVDSSRSDGLISFKVKIARAKKISRLSSMSRVTSKTHIPIDNKRKYMEEVSQSEFGEATGTRGPQKRPQPNEPSPYRTVTTETATAEGTAATVDGVAPKGPSPKPPVLIEGEKSQSEYTDTAPAEGAAAADDRVSRDVPVVTPATETTPAEGAAVAAAPKESHQESLDKGIGDEDKLSAERRAQILSGRPASIPETDRDIVCYENILSLNSIVKELETQYERLVERGVLKAGDEMNVLDVGCGSGKFLTELYDKLKGRELFTYMKVRLYGLALKGSSDWVGKEDLITFRRGYAELMPEEWSGKFHYIVSVHTIGFSRDELAFMEGVHRVLAPYGIARIHSVGGLQVENLGGWDKLFKERKASGGYNLNITTSGQHLPVLVVGKGGPDEPNLHFPYTMSEEGVYIAIPPRSAEPKGGSQKSYKTFEPKNYKPEEDLPSPLPDIDGTVKMPVPSKNAPDSTLHAYPMPLQYKLHPVKFTLDELSFLDRHMKQWEWLSANFVPAMVHKSRITGEKKICILSLGCSTGEELARAFYEIVTALIKLGEQVEEWNIQLDGIEHDKKVAMEMERRLRGESPFAYNEWDGYTHDVWNTLNKYSDKFRNSACAHVMDIYNPDIFGMFTPDLVLANSVLHFANNSPEKYVFISRLDDRWVDAWVASNNSDITGIGSAHHETLNVPLGQTDVRDNSAYNTLHFAVPKGEPAAIAETAPAEGAAATVDGVAPKGPSPKPPDVSDVVPPSFGGATNPSYYIPEVLQAAGGSMSRADLLAAFNGKNIPMKDVTSALAGHIEDGTVLEGEDGLLHLAAGYDDSSAADTRLLSLIKQVKIFRTNEENTRLARIWSMDTERNLNKALESLRKGDTQNALWWFDAELREIQSMIDRAEDEKKRGGFEQLKNLVSDGKQQILGQSVNNGSVSEEATSRDVPMVALATETATVEGAAADQGQAPLHDSSSGQAGGASRSETSPNIPPGNIPEPTKGSFIRGENGRLIWSAHKYQSSAPNVFTPEAVELVMLGGRRGLFSVVLERVDKLKALPESLEEQQRRLLPALSAGYSVAERIRLLEPAEVLLFLHILDHAIQTTKGVPSKVYSPNMVIPGAEELVAYRNKITDIYDETTGQLKSGGSVSTAAGSDKARYPGAIPGSATPAAPADDTIRAADPAELLIAIRYDDGPGGLLAKALGEGFSVKNDLCPRMSPYNDKRLISKAYYNLVKPLIDVGIFVRIDGRVKFSDMMIDLRGRTREHAKNLINVVNNIKLKTGKNGDKTLLRQGSIPPKMFSLAREVIRLNIVDYAYKKATLVEKPYTIKVWEDYAAVNQKPFLTEIKNLTNGKVSFEKDIDKLVSFALNNVNDSTVTILPLKLLGEEQVKELERVKAKVIYINIEGEHVESDDLTNLEGLIGVGRAYLNNDDESFYRLYRLLTLQPASYVPLKELKDNPVDFIKRLNFTLKPITPYDSNERIRIRHCQEMLLKAA